MADNRNENPIDRARIKATSDELTEAFRIYRDEIYPNIPQTDTIEKLDEGLTIALESDEPLPTYANIKEDIDLAMMVVLLDEAEDKWNNT